MEDFATYYKLHFQQDLRDFINQIPVEGNKHYSITEISIQYFFLTPRYRYLEIIQKERQALFIVSLFWTVLVDQVFFTCYRSQYPSFQKKTAYPKFIGNCTAPSLLSSDCGHHQHPKKILQAVNDFNDPGNRVDFDREIFIKDENKIIRGKIEFATALKQSINTMEIEIKNYFENNQPEVDWADFLTKCKQGFQ